MIETARRWLSVFDDRRAAETVRDLLQRAGITIGGDAPTRSRRR